MSLSPAVKPPPTRRSARAIARRWRRSAALLATALLAVFAAFPSSAQAVTVPGAPSGWTTVFSDGFAGGSGSAPSSSNWIYDTGPGSNFGTGEIETMTNSTSNVHLDGSGHLDITALNNGGNWTSGRIQTPSANVGAPAGGKLQVTASIQQPNPGSGLGYWPAFWMLGPGQWPENGEIDIMEDVNALSQVAGTIHCGTYPGGVCNEGNGIGSGLRACGGCQTGYHTYSMILDRTNTSAETITWYLDGAQYFSVSESQVGASTWQQAFDHNLSIIFDLAIGGGFPNGVCNCTTPTGSTSSGATMSVGYVAAYTTTGSGGGGGGGTGTGGAITGYGGLCLDDRSSSTANYNPIQVYTCNGTNAQKWTFVQAGTTLHVLGKCLDVYAAGTANGTPVDLYDCNNTGSQVWIPQSNGSLYNPQSNKCLDDTGWSTTPGTQTEIWDCTGGANQKWNLP
ncbi:ricin-type beta-trefoil lectin domain protein [Streptacidiphilus sp. N1-12]|uniref:Ricin-type beta-trefoil lectin domain protein n=2 Tax=Streptacidiphilus alkalitolerans TaxID=3342712 RepID=A0ABV6V297_9ACTN